LRQTEFTRSPLSDDASPVHDKERQYSIYEGLKGTFLSTNGNDIMDAFHSNPSFIARPKANSFMEINRETQIEVVDKDKLKENLSKYKNQKKVCH